jgi:transglutaminase-like putative cysteine protease
MTVKLDQYLKATDVVDWHQPSVIALARTLAPDGSDPVAIARRCFEWVRDEIRHSWDYSLNPVTCSASEVLEHGTGLCYAKSHLLAALLRASGIPAGFCYQRLSRDEPGEPYCLHGLNAVYLPAYGWYLVDARGNKPGVDAQFAPPVPGLAFEIRFPGEYDLSGILADPRPDVVAALRRFDDINDVWADLPDGASGE